ncbi:MAG: MFS transporter [Candidatus Eremiobacteraeota bacterium]|nr:MFS transporter [Candidatus Eremiobacteraeota bacterium]
MMKDPKLRFALLAFGLIIACYIDRLTSSSTAVILPWAQGDLALSGDQAPVVTLCYNAAYYTGILLGPWLLRRFGRPRYFVWSLGLYAVASLLCAFSNSLLELSAFRVLQGVGEGAFFLGGVLTIFANLPPDLAKLFVLAYAITSQVGSGTAPLIGGLIVNEHSWRWLYVALGLAGFVAAAAIGSSISKGPIDRGLDTRPNEKPTDLVGMTLLALAVTAYSYATAFGELHDWLNNADVTTSLIVFALAGVAFIVWEAFGARAPIVPIRLLTHRNALLGIPLGLAIGFPLLGTSVHLLYLQNILNFPLHTAGAVIALRALTLIISAPLGSILLIAGVDSRLVIGSGFATSMLAFLWEAAGITSGSDFHTFVGAELLIGLGFGLTYAPLLYAIITNIPFAQIPFAIVATNLSYVSAGSFANSLLSTVFDHRDAKHLSDLAGSVTLSRAPVMNIVDSGAASELHRLGALVAQQAAVMAFADVALCAAGVAAVSIVVTLLLRRASPPVLREWFASLASPAD